jgi:hypothetical protein
MAEATRLKIWHHGHHQWQHPSTKFHENPNIGSKVISGDTQTRAHTHTQTDKQAGDFMSTLIFGK